MTDPLGPSEFDSFAGRLLGKRKRSGEGDPATGVMGMTIFLASLSVLFIASVVGVLIVRFRADQWQPDDTADFPMSLWVSTILLIISSITVHRALRAAQRGMQATLVQMLAVTLLLGIAFMMVQGVNWVQLYAAGVTAKSSLYAFTFFILTALHAAHVVGGILPLFIITLRAGKGRYGPDFHPGVKYISMYWHFLDVVWVVLFILLISS